MRINTHVSPARNQLESRLLARWKGINELKTWIYGLMGPDARAWR